MCDGTKPAAKMEEPPATCGDAAGDVTGDGIGDAAGDDAGDDAGDAAGDAADAADAAADAAADNAADAASDAAEIESKEIPASALGADGAMYELGKVLDFNTIRDLKQVLSQKSGMSAWRQQMFLMDDTREDAPELRNHESVAEAMAHAESDTQLQLAVMLSSQIAMTEFVADLASKPKQMIGKDMNKPIGLTFVPNHPHLLLNVEMYGNCISLFDVTKPQGSGPLAKVGSKGAGELMFDGSYGICATDCWHDGSLCVVVAERSNNRLQVIKLIIEDSGCSARFEFVRFIGESLRLPHGVVARKGNDTHLILATDTSNNCIREFDVNDGRLVAIHGRKGSSDGEFNQPHDLCALNSGGFAVADRNNARVQVFNKEGAFAHSFGTDGCNDGQLRNADGIESDANDNILIIDTTKRIQLFTIKGGFIRVVKNVSGCSTFHYRGVAWDGDGGRLAVSDYDAKAITLWQVFD
jgi:hypothetical protein